MRAKKHRTLLFDVILNGMYKQYLYPQMIPQQARRVLNARRTNEQTGTNRWMLNFSNARYETP